MVPPGMTAQAAERRKHVVKKNAEWGWCRESGSCISEVHCEHRVLQEAASLSKIFALPMVSNVLFTGRPDKQIGRTCQQSLDWKRSPEKLISKSLIYSNLYIFITLVQLFTLLSLLWEKCSKILLKKKKRKGMNMLFSLCKFTFSQMQLEASSREIFTYVLVSFWLPPHFLYSLEPIWCFKLGVEMPYWTKATNSDFFFL